jgi:hypothetical protein
MSFKIIIIIIIIINRLEESLNVISNAQWTINSFDKPL